MKKILLVLQLSVCSVIGISQTAVLKKSNVKATTLSTDTSVAKKNRIALLGMYHFNNPNQDQFNVKSDDVLSAKRQKEIQQLVLMLAKYKPTHIALEFNASDTALDEKYQRYLKGIYELESAEREQIGFRLAKMLGHRHIYPVDAPDLWLNFEPGKLAEPFMPLLQQLDKEGNNMISKINQWQEKYTIGQTLAKLNSPAVDQLNVNLYYKYILPVGNNEQQPGLEAVTRWYKRNLAIFNNIMKLAEEKNGQRILVVFGQGHTAMLNQFLQYSDLFIKEDIKKYLSPAH